MARRLAPLILGDGRVLPEAPFLYNDPRICYNEPCFEYNGGFDLICLGITPRTRVMGGRSGKKKAVSPQPEMINLLFKTCFQFDENEFDLTDNEDFCQVKEYSFKKETSIEVRAKNFTSNQQPNLGIKASTPKRVEKQDSPGRLKSYVSGSLVLNQPRRIFISASRIEKTPKK